MNEFHRSERKHDGPPLKAILYGRISSLAQAKKGDGLASQEARCREYAAYKGYEVVKVIYDRAQSGGLMDRPGIREMLQFLKREKHAEHYVVVFDDISRLARDIRIHLDLRDAIFATGAQMDCPTVEFRQDSDGRYFEGMQALNAEHYRHKNAEQTRNRMRSRAMNGYWPFQSTPGYKMTRVEGRGNILMRDEPVASIIQEGLEGFASGRLETQGELKRFLESRPEFMATRKNRELRYEDVLRFLTRPHYAGYIEIPDWGVSLRKGHHEGLITLERYEQIQARIREGARAPARKDIDSDFILRGAVACGDCGKPLTACWSKSKTGKKHPYYMCFNKECDSHRKSIRRDEIEGEFEELLRQLTPSETTFDIARAMFKHAWETRLAQAKEIAAALKAEVTKLDRQIENLLDRIVDATSTTTANAYERRISKLEREKQIAAERLAKKPGPQRPFEEMFELACDFLSSPWNLWQNNTPEARRTVLKLAFSERPAYSRNQGFRTPKTSIIFKLLGEIDMGKCEVAERGGFEPPIRLRVCRISSAVHSTTLPPLRGRFATREGWRKRAEHSDDASAPQVPHLTVFSLAA